MAPLTTLGVGGPARYFLDATDIEQVRQALECCRENRVALWLMGEGSNTLVADGGFDGLVLRYRESNIKPTQTQNEWRIGAGCSWDKVVAWAVNEGLGGIECLSGIPGWVGAAPMQNIGAYGQELADALVDVGCVSIEDGARHRFAAPIADWPIARVISKGNGGVVISSPTSPCAWSRAAHPSFVIAIYASFLGARRAAPRLL